MGAYSQHMFLTLAGPWVVHATVCVIAVVAAAAPDTKPADLTGVITYPAFGNLSLEEGTIECWVTLAFDPEDAAGEWYRFFLFAVRSTDEQFQQFQLFWRTPVKGFTTNSVVFEGVKQNQLVGKAQLGWKKGEMHHIALTWANARDYELYLDGQCVSRGRRLQRWEGNIQNLTISIGLQLGAGRYACPIVVDELRVSSVARKPNELGFFATKPLSEDVFTLILDHFDGRFTPNGKRQTRCDVISRFSSEVGGTPSRQCRFVKGKFGRALALFTP